MERKEKQCKREREIYTISENSTPQSKVLEGKGGTTIYASLLLKNRCLLSSIEKYREREMSASKGKRKSVSEVVAESSQQSEHIVLVQA